MILDERKTEISWDAESKIARIWTNDPAMIKRMDVLCEHHSGAYRCKDRYDQSATYTVPSKLICFRFPTEEELRAEKNEQDHARGRGRPRKTPDRH